MISLEFQPWGDLFLLKTLLPWFSKCPHFPAFSRTITQSPLWAPFFTHFFVSLHYHGLPSAGPHSPSSSSGTTWVAVTPSCVSQAHTSLQATHWPASLTFHPGYDTCCQPCSLQHCSCLDTGLLKTPVTLPGTGIRTRVLPTSQCGPAACLILNLPAWQGYQGLLPIHIPLSLWTIKKFPLKQMGMMPLEVFASSRFDPLPNLAKAMAMIISISYQPV